MQRMCIDMEEFQAGELGDEFPVSGRKLVEPLHGKTRGSDLFQVKSANDRCVREPKEGVLGFLRQKRRWKDVFSFS